ncbi:hypothetical protein PMAYCL1PPCAC_05809, partial [Pristionchus mayeri]
ASQLAMGGWKLESFRFFIAVTFPVGAFWFFNQPELFKYFMKGYRIPDTSAGDAAMAELKESIMVKQRKEEYERFLKEQMAFEQAKIAREKMGL